VAKSEAAKYWSLKGAYAALREKEEADRDEERKPTVKYLENKEASYDQGKAQIERKKALEAASQALINMQRNASKTRLLSQNLIAIFSYCD